MRTLVLSVKDWQRMQEIRMRALSEGRMYVRIGRGIDLYAGEAELFLLRVYQTHEAIPGTWAWGSADLGWDFESNTVYVPRQGSTSGARDPFTFELAVDPQPEVS